MAGVAERVAAALGSLGNATAQLTKPVAPAVHIELPTSTAPPQRKRSLIELLTDQYTSVSTVEGGPDAAADSSSPARAAPPAAPARPWSQGDFLARLASFGATPVGWFGKPDAISPPQCARYGWALVARDTLGCAVCSARLAFSAGSASGMDASALQQLATSFVERLTTQHSDNCAWRGASCPAHFATLEIPSAGGADALAASVRQEASAIAKSVHHHLVIDAAAADEVVSQLESSANKLSTMTRGEQNGASNSGTAVDCDTIARALLSAISVALGRPSHASAAALGDLRSSALAALLAPEAAAVVAALCGWTVPPYDAETSGGCSSLTCRLCGKVARVSGGGEARATSYANNAAGSSSSSSSSSVAMSSSSSISSLRAARLSAMAAARRALAAVKNAVSVPTPSAHEATGANSSSNSSSSSSSSSSAYTSLSSIDHDAASSPVAAASSSAAGIELTSITNGRKGSSSELVSSSGVAAGSKRRRVETVRDFSDDEGEGDGQEEEGSESSPLKRARAADGPSTSPASSPIAASPGNHSPAGKGAAFHPLRSHAWYCPLVRPGGCALPAELLRALLSTLTSAGADSAGRRNSAASGFMGSAVAAALTTIAAATGGPASLDALALALTGRAAGGMPPSAASGDASSPTNASAGSSRGTSTTSAPVPGWLLLMAVSAVARGGLRAMGP